MQLRYVALAGVLMALATQWSGILRPRGGADVVNTGRLVHDLMKEQDLERRSKAALSVVYLANAEHVRPQLRKEGVLAALTVLVSDFDATAGVATDDGAAELLTAAVVGLAKLCTDDAPSQSLVVHNGVLEKLGEIVSAAHPRWVAASAHLLHALQRGPHRQLVDGFVDTRAGILSEMAVQTLESGAYASSHDALASAARLISVLCARPGAPAHAHIERLQGAKLLSQLPDRLMASPVPPDGPPPVRAPDDNPASPMLVDDDVELVPPPAEEPKKRNAFDLMKASNLKAASQAKQLKKAKHAAAAPAAPAQAPEHPPHEDVPPATPTATPAADGPTIDATPIATSVKKKPPSSEAQKSWIKTFPFIFIATAVNLATNGAVLVGCSVCREIYGANSNKSYAAGNASVLATYAAKNGTAEAMGAAAEAVEALVRHDEALMARLGEAGVLDDLLKELRPPRRGSVLQTLSLLTLAAQTEGGAEQLISGGALTLCTQLFYHPNAEPAWRASCLNLVTDLAACERYVVEAAAPEADQAALEATGAAGAAVKSGAASAASAARAASAATGAAGAGGALHLARCLLGVLGQRVLPGMHVSALQALRDAAHDPAAASAFVGARGLPAAVALLGSDLVADGLYTTMWEVQTHRASVTLLAMLVAGHPGLRREMASAGVIPALVACMDQYHTGVGPAQQMRVTATACLVAILDAGDVPTPASSEMARQLAKSAADAGVMPHLMSMLVSPSKQERDVASRALSLISENPQLADELEAARRGTV
ncbi:hypothetical protein FOA52_009562 [Chlamydomonas sp. UWO 241]|nr:hypothetical protein FOA52_009562 [Chlamydomonas sp. UWO 241]